MPSVDGGPSQSRWLARSTAQTGGGWRVGLAATLGVGDATAADGEGAIETGGGDETGVVSSVGRRRSATSPRPTTTTATAAAMAAAGRGSRRRRAGRSSIPRSVRSMAA